jgi:hypothetical protein
MCVKLKKVSIPFSTTEFGMNWFKYCDELPEIMLR